MANLFKKIFRKSETPSPNVSKEQLIFGDLFLRIQDIKGKNVFISKKELDLVYEPSRTLLEEIVPFEKSGMLQEYCKNKGLRFDEVSKALKMYATKEDVRQKHNEKYLERALVENKEYLDQILAQDNPEIILDEEQRRVVLNDEDYCLVIAGAGAGKTTTIAAKVKYLVEKKKVDPAKILVVSFTQKAVNELKERIQGKLKINPLISTFHSIGNSILRDVNKQIFRVASEGMLYNIVREYITKNIYFNPEMLKKLILFFGYYIDAPPHPLNKAQHAEYTINTEFSTLKSNLGKINEQIIDKRNKKQLTINNELVKSFDEVQIANFLYLKGLDYEYEKEYPFIIPGATKIYTPDFCIQQGGKVWYLEHFGITESGTSNRYSELELMKYKGQIADKMLIHQEHGTNLITTYSTYIDRRSLLEHLEEELLAQGIEFHPRKDEEVYLELTKANDNKYFDKLIRLITRFIGNFKTKDYSAEDFSVLRNQTNNVRSRILLDICEQAYLEYQRRLKENNRVDFDDMINQSSRALKEIRELEQKLDLEYIIVDEYQDISRQRFNLTQVLSEVTDAKIIAVGDDWQSVYAFAGSEINLFTKFQEEMGYADILHITHTYRNSQELIEIAGKFVQANPTQIRKQLISPKSIEKPVLIYGYSDDSSKNEKKGREGFLFEKAKRLEQILKLIVTRLNKDNPKILLVGRYNFDVSNLGRTPNFNYNPDTGKITSVMIPTIRLTFLTAHKSKGLTFDEVVIINASNETYGFPSQIVDDPVLNLVTHFDRSYEYAEERRLFYVALTRTKNRVFILAPENKPSKFVLELQTYQGVTVHGTFNQNYVETKDKSKICPVCGYPLQLRSHKTYGLKLYMCTNEPELCDFMTNDLRGGATTIRICPACVDGYLIVKKRVGEHSFFLGCTNYDGKRGCVKTLPLG